MALVFVVVKILKMAVQILSSVVGRRRNIRFRCLFLNRISVVANTGPTTDMDVADPVVW